MSKEEYLKRKEYNERQIAHWEARTTATEKAAIELAMCMEALDNLARLWKTSSDEDKQQMARVLFEYVVYDLDQQRIVDFRLKPWADRYLVLRAALYDDPAADDLGGDGGGSISGSEDVTGTVAGEEKENRSRLKATNDLCPIGGYEAGLSNICRMLSFTVWCSCTLGNLPRQDQSPTTRQPSASETRKYEHAISRVKV